MDPGRVELREADVWVEGKEPDRTAEDRLTSALAEGKLTAWGDRADGIFCEVPAVYWSKHVASGLIGLAALGHAYDSYRLRWADAERIGLVNEPRRHQPREPKHPREVEAWPLLATIEAEMPDLRKKQGATARELRARWSGFGSKVPSEQSCERYVRDYRSGR